MIINKKNEKHDKCFYIDYFVGAKMKCSFCRTKKNALTNNLHICAQAYIFVYF